MRPIALDTNTYAGCQRADPAGIEVFQRAEQLRVSTVVLAELLSAFACGAREAQNREESRLFLDCSRVVIKETGPATADADADAHAQIYATLRLHGRPEAQRGWTGLRRRAPTPRSSLHQAEAQAAAVLFGVGGGRYAPEPLNTPISRHLDAHPVGGQG